MPYRMPMQNQPSFHNMMNMMNQGNLLRPDLRPNMNARNYPVPHGSYAGSYTAVPGLQRPMVYPRGMIGPRLLNSFHPGRKTNSATSSRAYKNSTSQIEGCYLYLMCVYIPVFIYFFLSFSFLKTCNVAW